MHRLLLLPWVALVVGVFSLQCAELSKDCRNTLTCDEAPTLGADCVWRYSDGSVWQGGPRRTAEGLWQWPNGGLTRTQDLTCPAGDAGVDGGTGPIFLGDCPRVACDAPQLCHEPSGLCVECLDNTACSGAVSSTGEPQPVCDPQSHACVACRSDRDCRSGHCKVDPDPRRNACVECVQRSHCPSGQVCDGSANECTTTCTGPGQCDDPDKPICSNLATGAATGVCVECLDNSVCAGSTPQCNTVRKRCVQCVDDSVCGGRVCSNNNRCVECVDDTRCGGATPNCDLDSNTCVGCLNNAQCLAAEASKCNTATKECEPCTDDIQCEPGLPVCSGGRCVACRDNSHCSDTPATPVCDTASGSCVACTDDSQCTQVGAARCDTTTRTCVPCNSAAQCAGKFGPKDLCRAADGVCAQCEVNGDCAGDPASSRCDAATGLCSSCQVDGDCNAIAGLRACSGGAGAKCVECTSDAFCTSNPNGRACNTTTNTCVECVTDAHCTSPGASRCSNNQCVPCVNDDGGSHCGHIVSGGTTLGVCDVSGGAAAGVCVECTGRERAACGTRACNSLTKVCSPFQVGSASLCGDCVSDAHCSANQRCVLEQFEGASLGTYSCFPVAVNSACPQTPFAGETTVNTIDGISEAVCLLRRTTCAGFNQANNRNCTDNDGCGEDGLDDGRCFLDDGVCSLPCTSGIDCFSGENDSCLGGICQL